MNDWKLRLRQSREQRELNKTAFAKRLGVSNATVTDWEKTVEDGGIKELSASSLVKIHEVLGVDLYWLLSGKGTALREGPSHAPVELSSTRPPLELVLPISADAIIETSTPEALQWVSGTEAELLTEFRCLAEPEQVIVLGTAKSLPHVRRARPRADQS